LPRAGRRCYGNGTCAARSVCSAGRRASSAETRSDRHTGQEGCCTYRAGLRGRGLARQAEFWAGRAMPWRSNARKGQNNSSACRSTPAAMGCPNRPKRTSKCTFSTKIRRCSRNLESLMARSSAARSGGIASTCRRPTCRRSSSWPCRSTRIRRRGVSGLGQAGKGVALPHRPASSGFKPVEERFDWMVRVCLSAGRKPRAK